MKLRISGLLVIAAFVVACLYGSTQALAQNAYIANEGSNTVSVIDTATNTLTATIPVGKQPFRVAVSPDGSKVYVTNTNLFGISSNSGSGSVSVIDTATNSVTATIPVGNIVEGPLAVTPDGGRVYVAFMQYGSSSFSVLAIDTAINTVIATIPVGIDPVGVAVTPDGSRVYVANFGPNFPNTAGSVSVIDAATNTVTATIPVDYGARGLAVTPDGSRVYVINGDGVSVIDTASNTAIDTIPVCCTFDGAAVTPDGSKVYVVSDGENTNVSVIDTASNTAASLGNLATGPGVAVSPDGSKVYVTSDFGDVLVIATATNRPIGSFLVGTNPLGISIKPGVGNPGCATADFMRNVILAPVGHVMFASFFPPPTVIGGKLVDHPSIFQYAAYCGFKTFDWRQEWTVLPPVSSLIPELPSLVPNNVSPASCSGIDSPQWPDQGCHLIAGPASSTGSGSSYPPLSDPPPGAYVSNPPGFNPFPFYYPLSDVLPGAPVVCPVNGVCPPYIITPGPDGTTNSGATLSFEDNPEIHALPGDPPSANPMQGHFVAFWTALVGVYANDNPSLPLKSWTWNSTFNGTKGGVDQGQSLSPIDSGSGTGGVTITSINGVQLPTSVSASQITTTASGLAYSRVSRTFNGTMTLTNISGSAISGPLQILCLGMPPNVTLVNATGDLSGTPYVTVPAASGLPPGQSITVTVQFNNPSNSTINFTPTIYSGSIS
jgi:YVTN family beta-propeller protein